MKQVESRLQAASLKMSRLQESSEYTHLTEKIVSLKKVYEIEQFMAQYDIRRNYAMDRLLTALDRIQPQMEQYKPIKDVRERLEKALKYSETALGIHVKPEQLPMNHNYSLDEVQNFLTKLSMAFRDRKVNVQNGTRSIQGIHLRMQYIEQLNEKYMDSIRETVLIFEKLKEEILTQFKEQNSEKAQQLDQLKQEINTIEQQQKAIKAVVNDDLQIEHTIEELQQQIATNELQQIQVETQLQNREKLEQQLKQKSEEFAVLAEQMTLGQATIVEKSTLFKEINAQRRTA